MNEQDILNFVSDYRKKTANKLANPYVFGVLALWYAYKGRLGTIERAMVGIAGAVTIYSNYKNMASTKAGAGVIDYLETYAKGAAGGQMPSIDLTSLQNLANSAKIGV